VVRDPYARWCERRGVARLPPIPISVQNNVFTNFDQFENLKYSKNLPYAFSEHGAIMAASVLNSKRAVEVSVYIVRAFVKLRRMIAEHKELSRRVVQIESHLADHDEQIIELIKAIKQLLKPDPPPKKRRIGFHVDKH